jgi:hypothetical protein
VPLPSSKNEKRPMNLADATFNDRDELSALFEKKPSDQSSKKRLFNHLTTESDDRGVSSYESYRSQIKTETSKKQDNYGSLKQIP